jgi:ATP-dependent helicase/nuclease subunit B
MDAQRFPGRGLQDPVLLDRDRANLSDYLTTTLDRITGNIYAFAVAFAGIRGKAVLSYSAYDPIESRENAPSSVLLQAYRLATGNREADYSVLQKDLLESLAGYAPSGSGRVLDNAELWLSLLAENNRLRPAMKSVKRNYKLLTAGIAAQNARESEELTGFDGQLGEPSDERDPRSRPDQVISASRMELLASCPRKYFFRYVLKLEPLEEDVPDPGAWLGPAERGSLLHDVFKRFMQKMRDKGRKTVTAKDGNLLHKKLAEVVAEYSETYPPPGKLVYEVEVEELRRTADVFLRMEAERDKSVTPLYFEVGFGRAFSEDEDTEEIATPEPVKVTLKEVGTFSLSGRIDRIDGKDAHEYSVWDYKTGSDYMFRGRFFLRNGRLLQHALYSLAAENLLRKTVDPKARIVEAGYIFPAEKTGGRPVRLSQDRPGIIAAVLTRLFDILRAGTFVSTSNEKDCGFCDYSEVCRAEDARAEIGTKMENDSNGQLMPFIELRNNEDYG